MSTLKRSSAATASRLPVAITAASILIALILIGLSACAGPQGSQSQSTTSSIDWDEVGDAMGKKGQLMAGDVYRINLPRGDLSVTSEGVDIMPGLALGSYTAFKQTVGDEAIVMGDLVLTENEYNRVISRLQEGGIEQTAIHKHLIGESPAIWWTHIHGRGDPVDLAQTIRTALDLTGTPLSESGGGSQDLGFDTERLDEILGRSGRTEGGIYKYNIPRAESVTEEGTELPSAMGVETVMNFQPTRGGQAAINGDFAMTAEEVNPVIRALRDNGIEVVSLHNHGLSEEPHLFYMHFWANDDAEKLARGLRAALDETNLS